jgi:hypothetical protein
MDTKNRSNSKVDTLNWPVGRPQTPLTQRQASRFRENGAQPVTLDQATLRLRQILNRMKAENSVVTFNPTYYGKEPRDTGVAVYFVRKGVSHCMPCDKWNRVADNMAAIAAHLMAIHGMSRWGVGDMDQAFAGYKALPAMGSVNPWWVILGFKAPPIGPVALSEVQRIYLERISKAHPDLGGNETQAAEINVAMREAREFYQKAA